MMAEVKKPNKPEDPPPETGDELDPAHPPFNYDSRDAVAWAIEFTRRFNLAYPEVVGLRDALANSENFLIGWFAMALGNRAEDQPVATPYKEDSDWVMDDSMSEEEIRRRLAKYPPVKATANPKRSRAKTTPASSEPE